MQVRYDGLAFGESPRWHDGRLWVCDWGAHSLLVFDEDGRPEVVARVDSFPFCIDWLPDGRLLIVNAARQAVVRESGEVYADRRAITEALPRVSERAEIEILAAARPGQLVEIGVGIDVVRLEFQQAPIGVERRVDASGLPQCIRRCQHGFEASGPDPLGSLQRRERLLEAARC